MKESKGTTDRPEPRNWKESAKREGSQLGSTWVRWWIALTLLGLTDLIFDIVRQLQFPWVNRPGFPGGFGGTPLWWSRVI